MLGTMASLQMQQEGRDMGEWASADKEQGVTDYGRLLALEASCTVELLLLLTVIGGEHRPQCCLQTHNCKHNSCAQRVSETMGTEVGGGVD